MKRIKIEAQQTGESRVLLKENELPWKWQPSADAAFGFYCLLKVWHVRDDQSNSMNFNPFILKIIAFVWKYGNWLQRALKMTYFEEKN